MKSKVVVVLIFSFIIAMFSIVSASAAINPAVSVPYNQPGLKIAFLSNNNRNIDEVYITKRDIAIDATTSVYNDNGTYYCIVVSLANTNIFDLRGYKSSSNTQESYLGFYSNVRYDYGGATYYYGKQEFFNGTVDQTLVPTFMSLNDAVESCISNLNYSPPPTTYPYTFNIPAGHAAYIKLSQEANVSLKCTMPELSKLWITGPQPVFWSGSYVASGVAGSYPEIGSNINVIVNNNPYIPWERGSDRNAYNQTKTAVYEWTETTEFGDYLIIYNPPYYDMQESDDQVISPTVQVTVLYAIEVKMYSVVNSYVNGTQVSTITTEYDVSQTGNITDPEGNPTTPEVGGGNYVPDNSDMTTTVGNLVSNIDEFFNGTWRYIRQLIESISTFPQFIVQLYSWLPSEFKGVLFSAFTIVVVVAVLKVML